MKCIMCGGPMTSRIGSWKDKSIGLPNVTLVGVEIRTCKKCGERSVGIPQLAVLHELIAAHVATKRGKLSGQEREKAKQGDKQAAADIAKHVHTRRQMSGYIYDADVVKRADEVLAPRYADRKGGYTRIIRAGYRRGDASPMAIIQLV